MKLPIHNARTAAPKSRPTFSAISEARGFVPNVYAVFGGRPNALNGFAALTGAFGDSSLSPAEREVIQLAVSVSNRCAYCVAGHTAFAPGAALDDAHVEAMRNGQDPNNTRLGALARFARKLTTDRGRNCAREYDEFLSAGFSAEQSLDVIIGVANKTLSNMTATLRRGITTALVLSTAYLGLGILLQTQAESRAKAVFSDAGISANSVFAIAAPFNVVLWKVIGMEEDRYHNVYLSLFDDDQDATIYTHPRHPELIACLSDFDSFEQLTWFSRGYYRVEQEDDKIVVSDLRMGLTPSYAFRFAIAERSGKRYSEILPETSSTQPRVADGDWDWLLERILGHPAIRAAEKAGLEPMEQAEPTTC